MRRAWRAAGPVLAALAFAAAAWSEDMTPSPHAVEAMRLLDSKDPYLRQLGFLRLEALREPATVSAVTRYLHSRNPVVRGEALRALAAIQGHAAIPTLLQSLAHDGDTTPRRAALLGLEPLYRVQADAAVKAALLKALRDRKPEVRMTAVDIASRLDDPDARALIQKRLLRERHRDVLRVLALAKKRMGL